MNESTVTSATIMVVDDHLEVLKTLKKILEKKGYKVRDFSDPLEALQEFKTNKPDIIISDLMMPQMNGIEFLVQIKKISPFLPFILMTAFATIESAIQSTKYGAFDYLRKPFELSKIYDTVARALQEQQTTQSH